MERIAIIPARSGSKGLPNKNIKMFAGKPLLAWSIIAARESGLFSEIMVSTDSSEYKDIAVRYGANVPFLRERNNASDTASTWDVVREVILNYKNLLHKEFDDFCLLQPTSPLRTSEDIKNAYDLFEKAASSVVSVCELEHSINTINIIPQNMSLEGFFDSRVNGRRQDSEKYYRINGAIYIQKTKAVLECENIYGLGSYAYVMDKGRSIDIDDEYDFAMAECIAVGRKRQ